MPRYSSIVNRGQWLSNSSKFFVLYVIVLYSGLDPAQNTKDVYY